MSPAIFSTTVQYIIQSELLSVYSFWRARSWRRSSGLHEEEPQPQDSQSCCQKSALGEKQTRCCSSCDALPGSHLASAATTNGHLIGARGDLWRQIGDATAADHHNGEQARAAAGGHGPGSFVILQRFFHRRGPLLRLACGILPCRGRTGQIN